MIQEMFKGRRSKAERRPAGRSSALLSLFNMAGRFGWARCRTGSGARRPTAIFFTLGPLLYVTLPYAGRIGSVALFVACAALILTMYGGGFATIPAYLSDLFGTQYVGAIHGRLLTAWSAAGVAGPGAGQLHPGVPDRPRGARPRRPTTSRCT